MNKFRSVDIAKQIVKAITISPKKVRNPKIVEYSRDNTLDILTPLNIGIPIIIELQNKLYTIFFI